MWEWSAQGKIRLDYAYVGVSSIEVRECVTEKCNFLSKISIDVFFDGLLN